ncbi:MAG TPA: DHH family phosphoesterase [Patescibacteria group bacterium]|nr:DHH family phosphoesterase [Patescibacteria group bacterium]
MRTIITSYKNPDLDGVACAFAYSELLRSENKDATATIFGIPQIEAQFVTNAFNIPALDDVENIIEQSDNIILVDTSNLNELSNKINPEKVIEIIDHRKINDASEFANAKIQIELVGSAATLVAERFYNSGLNTSKESATLLFLAIVSSTVNFQSKVTTDRDCKMADWLKTKFELSDNFIRDMFIAKSSFDRPLEDIMIDDLAKFTFNGKTIGIAQLEIVGVDDFVQKNMELLKKALEEIKKSESLDLVFITFIDLVDAYNEFFAVDEDMQKVLEIALNVRFDNGVAKQEGILMRKQIIPLVKEVLESI